MRDFNFFEPYLNRGRQHGAAVFRSRLLIAGLAALLAAWPLFNLGYGMLLQRQADRLRAEVAGSDKFHLLAQAKQEETGVIRLQAQLENLIRADQRLQAEEWLTEPFLYSIVSAVPKDVKLDSLSVQADQKISAAGTASGKPAVAELAVNLRATGRFEDIYISSVFDKDGTYSFDVSFSVKGGDA